MDDAPTLFAYRTDCEVSKYQSWAPASPTAAEEFIHELGSAEFGSPGAWYQLGIRRRDPDELIGDVGVHVLAEAPEQVEFGVTIAPGHQQRGFAREAVTAVIDHLFGVMRKHRVVASVDPRNASSLALLKSVGLRQEAHFKESLWFKGAWVDDVVFAVLASQWPRTRKPK